MNNQNIRSMASKKGPLDFNEMQALESYCKDVLNKAVNSGKNIYSYKIALESLRHICSSRPEARPTVHGTVWEFEDNIMNNYVNPFLEKAYSSTGNNADQRTKKAIDMLEDLGFERGNLETIAKKFKEVYSSMKGM